MRSGSLGTNLDATPSPSRRGLKQTIRIDGRVAVHRCNTVPIEKGTETLAIFAGNAAFERGCNTVPIEFGVSLVERHGIGAVA